MSFAPDTIVAISSAVGPAARMIVRMSGGEAHAIARRFVPDLQIAPSVARRCTVELRGMRVPAWAYVFVRPRSYTGEDLVELHVPGNPLLVNMLVDEIVRRGARPAEAGEFTARAFFNGRIDLTEAEGVAATIAAHSEGELRAARQLLAGELARRLREPMDLLAETLALVEVGIDFSDEDVTFLSGADVADRAGRIDAALADLVASSARFERLAHEPHIVLVGRPNAGKSTLLNALGGQDRAVVSSIAGTTRDAVSVEVRLARGIVRLVDVAGVDDAGPAVTASDPDLSPVADIERQMRERALRTVESADQVVLVRDATDDRPALDAGRRPDLVVRTKADLADADPADGTGGLLVSTITGRGMSDLRDALDRLAFGESTGGAGRLSLALNARHVAAIEEARQSLDRAAAQARAGAGGEIVALDLREALDALGRVLGQLSPDDLLTRIFSRFCIGK